MNNNINNNINEIKGKIRATNPEFTDELLDLLREYLNACQSEQYDKFRERMTNDKELSEMIANITLQAICTKPL